MADVKIRITGDTKLVKVLITEYPTRLAQAIRAGLIEIAEHAAAVAKPLSTIKTGLMRGSIRADVSQTGPLRAAVVAGNSQVFYAKFQEYGTMGSRIEVNDIRSLSAALRGRFPVRRSSGISPVLFVHRGVYETLPRIEQVMSVKLNELARSLNLNTGGGASRPTT